MKRYRPSNDAPVAHNEEGNRLSTVVDLTLMLSGRRRPSHPNTTPTI
jgi:hypothetical protein